jgi:hypothetical protein
VIVAAKGNDGSGKAFYPGSNAHVVSVGALDKNASGATIPASFTNYNKTSLDVMAPGAYIIGLAEPGSKVSPSLVSTDYAVWDGTSMSTPIVSGGIAWLWRAAPALSNAEITSEVLGSAAKKGKATHFPSGYRELDMSATYAKLKGDYPLLVAPSMGDFKVASLGSVPIAWSEPLSRLRGVTYSWMADALSGQTSASRVSLGLASGSHTFTVAAHSSYNWDDGTASRSIAVDVVPAVDGTSTWAALTASTKTPGYGKGVTLSATLEDASGTPLSGAGAQLLATTNGATSAIGATDVSGGTYSATFAPTSRTTFRFAFVGAGAIGGSTSAAVVVTPYYSLSTPSSKSSVKHTAHFSVTGTLKPAKSTGSHAVRLKISRWNGHGWVSYRSTWAHVVKRSSSQSSYSATLKLAKNRYRIYAYAPADANHSATTSGYKSVTVR